MEIVVSTQDHQNYLADVARGDLHLVTFAEDGTSIFTRSLGFLHIDPNEVSTICEQINRSEETGTLWPLANVTAIPKKFCREPLDDRPGLRASLRDAFVANRDYCKSAKLLFDFTGGVLNEGPLEDDIHQFAMGEFHCEPLEEVEVWFDPNPHAFAF